MLRKSTISAKLKKKLNLLKKKLNCYKGVVVALSGGVDSSLLTLISHDVHDDQVIAATAHSPIHSENELESCRKIAIQCKIRHVIIKTHELSKQSFISNPVNRCYICKKMLLKPLLKIAEKHGYQVIEASNLDDLKDYRPGRKAIKEFDIASPFIEAGLNKKDIRSLAKAYGLANWNQPSNACYASRIPYGQKITLKKIRRIAAAENYLRAFKLGTIRVRDHDPIARIELPEKSFQVIIKNRQSIIKRFKKLGYKYIAIDLDGYRTGSLNPTNAKRSTPKETSSVECSNK